MFHVDIKQTPGYLSQQRNWGCLGFDSKIEELKVSQCRITGKVINLFGNPVATAA